MSTGGEVANAADCKSVIRGFESHPVLHGTIPEMLPPFSLSLLDSITYKRFRVNEMPASILKSVEPY